MDMFSPFSAFFAMQYEIAGCRLASQWSAVLRMRTKLGFVA